MKAVHLFTPGPTPVPDRVYRAISAPMIHHRSDEFSQILQQTREYFSQFCETDGETVVFSSSGSGALEACVSSLFAPQDEVVVVEAGKFGQRWEELAKHYKLKTEVIRVKWGRAVEVDAVLNAITPSTKGVLIQACESSTGVYHPIQALGKALAEHSLLFVVDAITALGIHDLNMKRDCIDVLIGASQKAFMCPPGLGVVVMQPRAMEKVQKNSQSFYFSLARELRTQVKNQTAFTPSISLIRGLREALCMIQEEGKEALFLRHQLLQKMARASLSQMGLTLFNQESEATLGITAVQSPEKLDVAKWLKDLREKYGLWLAGGQAELAGKIFRLSHMGACWPKDLFFAISKIEESLSEVFSKAKERQGSKKAKEFLEKVT